MGRGIELKAAPVALAAFAVAQVRSARDFLFPGAQQSGH
jgi:hypothetical protein